MLCQQKIYFLTNKVHFELNSICKIRKFLSISGTGLLYSDIPFPLFYVEDENQIRTIKECFQKFNNFSYTTQIDRSLCSLELSAFMYATTNTPTCKR